MKKYLIIIFTLTALFAREDLHKSGREVLTKNEISKSGYSRLSDVLLLSNKLRIINYDGFRSDITFNGNKTFNAKQWYLLLDGLNIDIDYLDSRSINRLPINVDQVDSIVIINSSSLVNGKFANSGLIHIYTENNPNKFIINASYATKNETGDPGPFQFIDDNPVNVDQVGPDYTINSSVNFESIQASFSYKDHTHPATDQRLLFYDDQYEFTDRQVRLAGSYLRLSSRSIGISAVAGYSTTYDVPFSNVKGADLIYSKINSEQYSLKSSYYQAGFIGQHQINDTYAIEYQMITSVNKFESINDNFLGSKFSKLETDIRINGTYSKTEFQFGYNHIQNSAQQTNIFLTSKTHSFYGRANFSHIKNIKNEIGLHTSLIGNDLILGSYYNLLFELTRKTGLGINFTYEKNNSRQKSNPLFWYENGIKISSNDFSRINYDNTSEGEDNYTIDLYSYWYIINNLELKAKVKYKKYYNSKFHGYFFIYDDNRLTTSSVDYISHNGNILLYELSINHRAAEYFFQSISFQSSTASRDDLFIEHYKRFPEYFVKYKLEYDPYEDLSIWLMFEYISKTYWNDFSGIEDNSEGLFSEYLAERFLLDLTIRKKLLGERIELFAGFHNLLNQKITYYATGAYFPLAFSIKLKMNLEII